VKAWTLFFACATAAWLLWMGADSPPGRHEPWDADNQLPYLLAQGLLGAVFGAIEPTRVWRWPLGVYVGQAIGLVHSGLSGAERSVGPLVPLGMMFLLPYTVPACVGAAVGAAYARSRIGGPQDHDSQS
jgi:hypothetical protein